MLLPPLFFSGSDHATSPLSVWLHHILPAFLLLLLPVKIMVMRGKRSSWARILIPGSSRSLGLNSKVWIHDITCGAIICLLYWKPIPSPPPFFLENQHDRLGIFCPIRLYNVLHIELIRLCERVQLGFRTARVRSQVVVEVVGVKGPVKDPRVLLLAPLRSWMKDRMHVRTIILGSPSHPFLTVAQPIIRVVGPDRVRVR